MLPDETLLQEQQKQLAARVRCLPHGECLNVQPDSLVFSLDIQYVEEDACVAVDVRRYDGAYIGVFGGKSRAGMPYIPRFFCFREGPPLLDIVQKVMEQQQLRPAVLIVDGHGIAHPLRLGVASWLGVQLGLPTVGMAKDTLLPYEGDLAAERGSSLDILLDGDVVGKVLRTQTNTRPIFVSAGHLASLDDAVQLALRFSTQYRIPEPLRNADQWARQWAKNPELLQP